MSERVMPEVVASLTAVFINRFLKDGMQSWAVTDLGRRGDWLEAKEI